MSIPAEFYDEEYFTAGTKSNYAPYGPGGWADDLADMIVDYLSPRSVLDVGCARGYLVERIRKRGVQAVGFDISEWAIANSVIPEHTWVGRAEDAASYVDCDLLVATEVPEHLVLSQIESFMSNAIDYADRVLLLIAMGEPNPDEKDGSHVTIHPREWWEQRAHAAGWIVEDASRFNKDERSIQMGWNDRFMYLI